MVHRHAKWMVSLVRCCAVDAIRNYIEVGAAEGAGLMISK